MNDDDVLGDPIPLTQQNELRNSFLNTLNLEKEQRPDFQFPELHSVSLDRNNLNCLKERIYYALWRPNGTRYMMFINAGACYLIDKSFNFRSVQMKFPVKGTEDNDRLQDALVDGEMIIFTEPDSQKQIRIFLISDLMAINKMSKLKLDFYARWALIERYIVGPRTVDYNAEMIDFDENKQNLYNYDLEPFKVMRAEFWPLQTLRFSDQQVDDLYLKCVDAPYAVEANQTFLRWNRINSTLAEDSKVEENNEEHVTWDQLFKFIKETTKGELYKSRWKKNTEAKTPRHEKDPTKKRKRK